MPIVDLYVDFEDQFPIPLTFYILAPRSDNPLWLSEWLVGEQLHSDNHKGLSLREL